MILGFKLLGAGLATISLLGSGIGIGVVFGCLLLSMARNYKISNELFSYALLGFALTESIALLGLMMAFLLLYAF